MPLEDTVLNFSPVAGVDVATGAIPAPDENMSGVVLPCTRVDQSTCRFLVVQQAGGESREK